MARVIPIAVLGVGAIILSLALTVGLIVALVLAIRALVKYLKQENTTGENAQVRRSLGETLKEHRLRCQMTQEFVAESVGVSRQAVSKWENGISEPTAINLCTLAKLYETSPEELLQSIQM